MNWLELRFIPPLVTVVAGAAMALLSSCADEQWPSFLRLILMVVFTLLGISLALAAIVPYFRAGTTWHPTEPEQASTLITAGIYRFSRNPMYLALLIMLVGWGCWLGSLLSFLVLPFFLLYMTRFQIIPEERALEQKFGESYLLYKRAVRRWL